MTDKPMSLQEKLHKLFLLDQQMRGLRTRLDAGERRLAAQNRKLTQFETQLAELQAQSQQAQTRVRTLEGEVAVLDQRLARLREQINTITSNKEYSAALVEVSTLKQEKARIEEQALEHMTRVEELAGRIAEVAAQRDEQGKLVEAAHKEVQTAREEVGDRLDAVTAQRKEAAGMIPGEVLRTFDRLIAQHDGEAMSPITEENRRRKEYHCGGCFLLVPVERLNLLMRGGEEIVTCPSCGRILYLESALGEALTESLAKK